MAFEIARFKAFSREPKRQRLVYIDPFLSEEAFPSINPFAMKNRCEWNIGLMTQEMKRILDVLLKGAATTNQMDAVLYPCIATLLRRKDSSFEDLQRFMDDKNNSDLVRLGMKSPNRQHRLFFENKFMDGSLRATKH